MSSLADLREGDLAFGPIHGFTGAFVGAAQLALATVEPGLIWRQGVKEWFRKRHCGVITEASRTLPPGTVRDRLTGSYYARPDLTEALAGSPNYDTYETGVITAPKMVQAMPGGAEEIELRVQTHWTEEWTFLRPRYAEIAGAAKTAEAAQGFTGTPYDFLTYAAIPPYRAGLHAAPLERIISGTDTMMCSRLLDASLAAAGYHLFDDGRLPGNVTPSEAYRRLRALPHSILLPGVAAGWGQRY